MISDRLSHLQSQVQGYYKQLACKEEAKRTARHEDKELLQQQIDELKKELRPLLNTDMNSRFRKGYKPSIVSFVTSSEKLIHIVNQQRHLRNQDTAMPFPYNESG
jgi:hypothetical protein